MTKIRYLKIRFANRIMPRAIPYFRAAVIEATRRRSSLFHNHAGPAGFYYRYPLIQYKATDRKASIICLEDGTDDIHYLFQLRELDLQVGDRRERFEVEDVLLRYHQLQTWQAGFDYALKDWQALNQDNFRRYAQLTSEVERLQFLEKMLLGNLLTLNRSLCPEEGDLPIELSITRMKGQRWLPYKGQKILAFSLNFRTNLSLPDYVGLGKGVSVGFGSVKRFGGRHENFGRRRSDASFNKPQNR